MRIVQGVTGIWAKCFFTSIVVILFGFSSEAQNLIRNHSFEQYASNFSCSYLPSGSTHSEALNEYWSRVEGWQYPKRRSSFCARPATSDVLCDEADPYPARTGKAFGSTHPREFLVGDLTENLITGKTYKLTFRVRAHGHTASGYRSRVGTSRIGAMLSTKRPSQCGYDKLRKNGNTQELFINSELYVPHDAWAEQSIVFVANSSHSQITLGCFDPCEKFKIDWDDTVLQLWEEEVVSTTALASEFDPVDANGDGLSDMILFYRHAQQGLVIRTKLADGNGLFDTKNFASGDGTGVDKYPALAGDINGDGKTDVILRYRHPSKGLVIRTKISNGDGSYTPVEFESGDGAAIDTFEARVAYLNDDNRADLLFLFRNSKGLVLRSKISNGDGTFENKDFQMGDGPLFDIMRPKIADFDADGLSDIAFFARTIRGPSVHYPEYYLNIRIKLNQGDGTWINDHHPTDMPDEDYAFGLHAADLNADHSADLIATSQRQNGDLSIITLIREADGSLRKSEMLSSRPLEADVFPLLLADLNNDGQTDVVLRYRHPVNGLQLYSYIADGNGGFVEVVDDQGDGSGVDRFPVYVTDLNSDGKDDLLFRWRHSSNQGLVMRAKLSNGDGTFTSLDDAEGDGTLFDSFTALAGPTTPRYRPPITSVVLEGVAIEGVQMTPKGIGTDGDQGGNGGDGNGGRDPRKGETNPDTKKPELTRERRAPQRNPGGPRELKRPE